MRYSTFVIAATVFLSGCSRLADGASSITAPEPEPPRPVVQPSRIVLRCGGRPSSASMDSVLFVVDGILVSRGTARPGSSWEMNALRAEDIESIEVMKGPAAGRLYGSNGNGAIIITTKAGAGKTRPVAPSPAPAPSR